MTNDFEQDPRWRSVKPLAVPVRIAAKLLGIGTTSTWGLISTRCVGVIRIGRRTLVTMASLEALVALLASSSQLEPQELLESRNEGVEKVNSIKMTARGGQVENFSGELSDSKRNTTSQRQGNSYRHHLRANR